MSMVAFLTDFGQRDWYVAAMKGVALGIDPQLTLVDIGHDIPAGEIAAGAFVLSQCWLDFPPGAVFCAVVDPGVGSDRAPVALLAEDRVFVGPDNGLFGWLGGHVEQCHRLTNAYLFRELVTHTFHGRDIFAPVAARLASCQATLDQVGPEHTLRVQAPWPRAILGEERVQGQIIYIDHYGNAITNLRLETLEENYSLREAVLSLHPRRIPILKTFSDAPVGQALAYFGSGSLLEITVNGGNAARQLDLRLDQRVELHLK